MTNSDNEFEENPFATFCNKIKSIFLYMSHLYGRPYISLSFGRNNISKFYAPIPRQKKRTNKHIHCLTCRKKYRNAKCKNLKSKTTVGMINSLEFQGPFLSKL